MVDVDWKLHREGKVPARNADADYIEQYKCGIAEIENPFFAGLQKKGDKYYIVEEINKHPRQQGTNRIQNSLEAEGIGCHSGQQRENKTKNHPEEYLGEKSIDRNFLYLLHKANIRIILQVLQSSCSLGFIASVLEVIIADGLARLLDIGILVCAEVPGGREGET